MSTPTNNDGAAAAPSKRPPVRLTLEEKVWFDRRKNDLEQYSAFGAGIGAVLATGVTSLGPFSRRVQLASIVGCAVIGGGSGYLYADSKALARIEDLSAQSRLRKEYQQLLMEKKAAVKTTTETPAPTKDE
ncbi:hypothetical protein PybrP1_000546 [[Pythium] brassicae (nom. inval.)]|nr:hypothetical protein PybrP1_000546 [[Pythium] brassicae (nom. inval.)]